jgi:dUTP pyrophosphatase
MKEVEIKFKKLTKDSIIPEYMSKGSSGADIYADEELIINPGEIKLVSTGFKLSIPEGFEGQVRPRSGLALKHGITVLNAPGTIDSDYRGEVKVILINLGKENFKINKGDRIAQLIIAEVVRANFTITEELEDTIRSDGGFGHTGI